MPVLDKTVTAHVTSARLSFARPGVAVGWGKHGALLTQAIEALNSDNIAIGSIELGTAIQRLVAAKRAHRKSLRPPCQSAKSLNRLRRSIAHTFSMTCWPSCGPLLVQHTPCTACHLTVQV